MRRQLPVFSPLPLGSLARSVVRRREAVRLLEERLARTFEVPPEGVLLTGSGTEALGMALALSTRPPDRAHRVALPAYTCWDVGTAALWAGVEATYYDIDPADLTPDPVSFEAALERDVAAAVVSPLHGYPVDWEDILSRCRAHGCLLVEDAAQGQGSRWRGRRVGSLGDVSVLSFGRGKGWTGAGGGALLVRSEELHPSMLDLSRSTGPGTSALWLVRALGQSLLGRPGLYALPASIPGLRLGETTFHPPAEPTAMASRTAALLLATESGAEDEAVVRQRTGEALLARLSAVSATRIVRPAAPGAGFLRLPVRIPDADLPWELEARHLGVERGYPLALPDVPELRSLDPTGVSVPVPGARLLAAELFTVPTHSLLREEELDRIVALLKRA